MNPLFALLLTAFLTLGFQAPAWADYATTPQPYPGAHGPFPSYPYYPPAPVYPAQPSPFIMCFAQGLANGAFFYGVGLNVYAANEWALYACHSTRQYCRPTGCRPY